MLCMEILWHRDLRVLQLILESCRGTGCIVGLCMLYQGGFVHVTPRRICACYTICAPSSKYLDSACKQTAVVVYRTLIVHLTQAGMCHILVEVEAVAAHLVQHAQNHNTSNW